MKKLLSVGAIFASLSLVPLSASAFDVGNSGVAFDNAIEATYEFKGETYTLDYTLNVNYEVIDDVSVYAETSVDLLDVAYVGLDVGVTYAPSSVEGLTFNTYATFNETWDNTAITAGVLFEF